MSTDLRESGTLAGTAAARLWETNAHHRTVFAPSISAPGENEERKGRRLSRVCHLGSPCSRVFLPTSPLYPVVFHNHAYRYAGNDGRRWLSEYANHSKPDKCLACREEPWRMGARTQQRTGTRDTAADGCANVTADGYAKHSSGRVRETQQRTGTRDTAADGYANIASVRYWPSAVAMRSMAVRSRSLSWEKLIRNRPRPAGPNW